MKLFFKHLFPAYQEFWSELPFSPWQWREEGVFFSVLSFFEYDFEENALQEIIQSDSIFMDSGSFAATSMGFSLDPYEVAELQSQLKADLIVPLDEIILEEDSEEVIDRKITNTIKNTEIMLDYCPKGSDVVGPLQGLSENLIVKMFDEYRSLGLTKFALGGLVFQSNLSQSVNRIKWARKITDGYFLHIFGKFLHPYLVKLAIESEVDSVDGYGYILQSIKGLYIDQEKCKYINIKDIDELKINNCLCPVCTEYSLLDLQRGDKESQHLLIQHNINSLIGLKEQYISSLRIEKEVRRS